MQLIIEKNEKQLLFLIYRHGKFSYKLELLRLINPEEFNDLHSSRWIISIGVLMHFHADGDRSHLCQNLNKSRYEAVEFTNTPNAK